MYENQEKDKAITTSRNKRALEIFTRNGLAVRTLGDLESPMFILDERYLLSCFVNGNNLHFRRSPESGEITRSVRLTGDTYITKYEIQELIENSEHLPAYRIQHAESGMCLVGFNFFDQIEEETVERFPVFALYNPVIYINPGKAQTINKELSELGYNVSVI